MNYSGEAPTWFKEALDHGPEIRVHPVDSTPINYLAWGKPSSPGLVLIHGSGAHAHWWDFIAPFFADHYRVLAIDLSGMGDSGHRSRYSTEIFARDVISVCQHENFPEKPILVGHSFGGYVALRSALHDPALVGGVVLVDSPVRPPDYEWEHDPRHSPIRPKKVYPDLQTAAERFRLVPAQPCENQYILNHIARHSLRPQDDGWVWKFDENLYRDFEIGNIHGDLSALGCRVGVIYGESSKLFTQDVADYMFSVLDKSVPFSAIPRADHHLFLDQPLAFIAALRTLLAEWRHSRPNRRSKV